MPSTVAGPLFPHQARFSGLSDAANTPEHIIICLTGTRAKHLTTSLLPSTGERPRGPCRDCRPDRQFQERSCGVEVLPDTSLRATGSMNAHMRSAAISIVR